MFKKKFVNIQLLTCIRRWVSARALVVDACQMESIAADGGTLGGVTMPTTVLRNAHTYKYTRLFQKRTEFSLLLFFLRHDLKKINTLPIKDNNKSAVFILISVCYVKENWYQTCLSKSIRVQRSPCVTRGHVGFKINDLTLITTPKLTAWSLPQYL